MTRRRVGTVKFSCCCRSGRVVGGVGCVGWAVVGVCGHISSISSSSVLSVGVIFIVIG